MICPRLIVLMFCLLFMSSCSSRPARTTEDLSAIGTAPPSSASEWQVGKIIEGDASWYGGKFHGRQTASGEIFDMYAYSGAHKTMPLGSMVRVTHMANGRSLDVKINDRGPYAKGRILDLSYAAAKKLGYESDGTARVRIEILEVGKGKGAPPQDGETANVDQSSGSTLVVGSFDSKWKAERLYYYLKGRFSTIRISASGSVYRVLIGPFKSEQVKKKIYFRLRSEGFDVLDE